MTKEELKAEMRRVQEETQNEFIDRLLDQVRNLVEKAILKDYEPTIHEKEVFATIVAIIDNMKTWF